MSLSGLYFIGEIHIPYPDIFNTRKAKIAATLVDRAINLNSYQYRLLNRETPDLIEPIISHLKQSVKICENIAYKLELEKITEEAEQNEIDYLFSWNKMFYEEKHRLLDYIITKIGDYHIELLQDTAKRDNRKMECDFGGPDISLEEITKSGTVYISINDMKDTAELFIVDNYGKVINKANLIAKSSEDDNNFYLYAKRRTRKGKNIQSLHNSIE